MKIVVLSLALLGLAGFATVAQANCGANHSQQSADAPPTQPPVTGT